jgi:hypothetical protein
MRLSPRPLLGLVATVIAMALAAGCSDDGPSNPSFGTMRVQMTDAPGDFDEVNLVITGVTARRVGADEDDDDEVDSASEGWMNVNTTSNTYDLMDLRNGVFTTIGEAELPAGTYDQIRLQIGSGSNVVIDGVTHPLVVPSGASSGLKLKGQITLVEGGTTDVGIDFDAARSIHETGNGTWILRPVVRMVPVIAGGSIRGTIVPDSTAATVWLLQDPDSVASTAAALDGSFQFVLLPTGTYQVRVEPDSGWRDTTLTNVNVSGGQTTDLGTIQLTAQ